MDNFSVEIEGLRVVRGGREVLHGLALTIPRGSITGLIGPSGCGETTPIRCIVGVQIMASGHVQVLGLPAGSPPLRRRIGYSTQAPAVYADLTVTANLQYFASSEFQAVQFMPLLAAPQILLCGLFTPRSQMASVRQWLSDVMPLSYAVDAVQTLASTAAITGELVVDMLVVAGRVVLALGPGAATLRRRAP